MNAIDGPQVDDIACPDFKTDTNYFESLEIKYSHYIDVQDPSDKYDCSIPGAVVIAAGIVAIADFSNSSIKIIDTELQKITTEMKLTDRPDNLAILPHDILAVTLSDTKTILFLSIHDGLAEVRRLKLDGNCRDLVYNDNQLIVTLEWPGKVQIMGLDGQVNKSIEKDYYGNEFKSPNVTVGVNKNIYVSDINIHTITLLNYNGKAFNGYKSEHLIEPSGMIALDDGSILVCSSSNNKLFLIAENLEKSKVILEEKDKLYCPWSLALDREQNKFYVGSGRKCNFLNVYDYCV